MSETGFYQCCTLILLVYTDVEVAEILESVEVFIYITLKPIEYWLTSNDLKFLLAIEYICTVLRQLNSYQC